MGEYVNSKQVRFDKSHVSCGVLEVHHLPADQPIDVVFSIANNMYHKANGRPGAFVLFSDVVEIAGSYTVLRSRGQRLADAINKLQPGRLYSSKTTVNPRTGHTIRVWLWEVDHEAMRKWYTEEYANRVQEKL